MKLFLHPIKNFLEPKSIVGAAIHLNKPGAYTMDYVELSKKKNGVEISGVGKVNDIGSFLQEYNSPTALSLSIDGKGVIHKKLQIEPEENVASLLQRSLPNASLKDFYLFKKVYNSEECWVSIIRRDVLDALMCQFENSSIYVIHTELGAFNINSSLSASERKPRQHLKLNHKEYSCDEKGVESIQPQEEESPESVLNIDGKELKGNQLVAFGNALNYVVNGITPSELEASNQNQITEYRARKLYTIGTKVAAITLLTALLVNFFLFDYYRTEYQKSTNELTSIAAISAELNDLEIKRNQLKALLEKSGINNSTSTSFIADQLAATLPSGIILSSMEINPVVKDNKAKKVLTFQAQKLHLRGEVKETIILNDWIHRINEKEWVKEVVVKDFRKHQKTAINEFELFIEITT